jgi:hypothetical protein
MDGIVIRKITGSEVESAMACPFIWPSDLFL